MNDGTEYRHTADSLATELGCSKQAVRNKVRALGIGIDLGGRAGWRFTDADREALIESMRLTATERAS